MERSRLPPFPSLLPFLAITASNEYLRRLALMSVPVQRKTTRFPHVGFDEGIRQSPGWSAIPSLSKVLCEGWIGEVGVQGCLGESVDFT